MMTKRDEQTASGIHRLRNRLRRAAMVFARSRTTRCVRLTTAARASIFALVSADRTKEGESSELNLSKASLMLQPPQKGVIHEAVPSAASRLPIRDRVWTSPSIRVPWSEWQSPPEKALRKTGESALLCTWVPASAKPRRLQRNLHGIETAPMAKVQPLQSQRGAHPLRPRSSRRDWPSYAFVT